MSWLNPAAWTRATLAWPRIVATAALALSALAAAGLLRLDTEVGYRAFLGHHHPLVAEFDAFVDRFGGGLPLLAVWSCDTSTGCETALDGPSLQMAAAVDAELSQVDVVRRVESPATAAIMARQTIGLPTARRLVRDGAVVGDADELREQALVDPGWVRRLVSEDGRSGAVVLHLRDSSGDTAERAYAALRRAVRPWEGRGFDFYFVGGPVEFVVAAADLESSTARIIPVMVALIAVSLMVLFGAPAAAVIALLSVGTALLWTMGLMGWLGWSQNSLTQILPPLILVVGVCDAIHLLGRYAARSDASAPRAAVRAAAEEVGRACAMTSITTAAGFGSLAVSGVESIARFGVLSSFGVLASLVTTFTVMPLLVSRLPSSWFADRGHGRRWRPVLEGAAGLSTGRGRSWIIAVAVLGAVLGVAGARHLKVGATFEDLYGETSDVVRWAHATARYLRAPDTLEIAIEAPSGNEGLPVEAFGIVDRIQRRLEGRRGLGRSLSIVDVLRRLNGLLHGDELPLAVPEDDRGRPSSVYRLLRSRDPSVTEDLVDTEHPALRISVESSKLPQEELRDLLRGVRADVDAELPPGWTAVVTGPVPVVSRMIDAIRETQLESFALAGLTIFAMLGFFFRSLRLAAVAMVPTVLPVLVTLGFMGWMGIALDIGSAMVASVILGLAVDDAIHLLSSIERARGRGHDARSATRRALLTTGRAMTTTSIALAIGFATLTFSSWHSIASFGIVSSIAVLAALLAALLVLPALVSTPSSAPE